jgi:GGDEF domain-containing protein
MQRPQHPVAHSDLAESGPSHQRPSRTSLSLVIAGAAVAALVAAATAAGPGGALAGGAVLGIGLVAYAYERSRSQRDADRDPVTGLPNGQGLTRSWVRWRRRAATGHAFAVLMVTVDDRGASPALSRQERRSLGDGVRRACDDGEAAFTTGASRFVVLVPDAMAARITTLAERLRTCVRASLSPELAIRSRVRVCVSVVGRPFRTA